MVVAFEDIKATGLPSFEDIPTRAPTGDFLEELMFSDKKVEDWLPSKQAEVAGSILNSLDDPEKERVDLNSALLLSSMFGTDFDTTMTLQPQMMKQIFGDELVRISEKFKQDPVQGGFFSKVGESWRRGDAQITSDIAVYEAVFEGKGDELAVMEARSKMLLKQQLSPIEGNMLSELVYAGAEVVPGMARGYWNAIPMAFTGMATGALMGLAAGQVPPLTISPIEDVPLAAAGAKIGLKAGFMAGSALFWYKQGAGSMYASMTEKGYDPELSKTIAGVAAVPYAIVEFLQVKQLTPGLRQSMQKGMQASVMRVMAKAAKRYGTTWTVEVVEEVIQELIQIGAEDIAGFMSSKLGMPQGIGRFIAERARRTWETTKEAGKAMALLPIPGAVVDIRTGTKGIISAKKRAEINAKLKKPLAIVTPEAPEIPTEPPVVAPEAEVPAEVAKIPPKAEAVTRERQKDLLGREELVGGAMGKQMEFISKEDFKTLQERERIVAEEDIEGQEKLFAEEVEIKPTIETELGDEEFALKETGLSNKQRNAQIRKFRKMIREHPIYQQALAGAEAMPDLSGRFAVGSQEMPDIKQRFEGREGLLKKFILREKGGTRWDTRMDELGIEGDFDDFLDAVEVWWEARQKEGVFNEQAFETLKESKQLDAELMAGVLEDLEEGESPTTINARIAEWARENKVDIEDVKQFMIPEMTDEQRKAELETVREKDIELQRVEAEKLQEKEKLRGAEQVKLKGILAKQKVRGVEAEAIVKRKTKLRQQIHAVAATKGLSKKKLAELKKKHTGFQKLTGKMAQKKITTEQLESLLKAVQKARPVVVEHKKVLTLKQEKKISSLRENLIRQKQLTETDYADILRREARGKQAKYIDAKNFITIAEAQAVIKRIHNQAEITRVTEKRESAVRKNPEIAQHVDAINKVINDKRAETKRDPWQFESMRYYNEQMELKTGAPFFAMYQDITDTHLESTKTRTARLQQLANETAGFGDIAQDDEALERVSLYISSQSKLKTPVPEGITTAEKTLAKNIQKIFKEYENKARWTRFYWWYTTGITNEARQQGPYPIGDYDDNKTSIAKAVDIYESKGKDEVIKYLNTQDWGIIKSGYEPLENIVQKVRLYKPKATTVGKTHIEVRLAVEYHKQERNVIARLGSYMRQIDMLNDLSPKINAYVQLYEDNQTKFNDPAKVRRNIETWLQTVKRYNIEGDWWQDQIARLYAQAMRTVIMPSPVLAFRNLFQNLSFEHDKSILFDPRNKPLTGEDIEFLETYVQQQRAIIEEYFMLGEKPLPGLKFVSELVEKIKIYPWSDVTNRRWSFWAKKNQVDRALQADTLAETMDEAKFADISDFEQRMALSILAAEGEDAMSRYVARVHVADIHWLYERSQRAPVEMGAGLPRVYGNLMLFPRAYGEKLAKQANKFLTAKDYNSQWRPLKVIMATIAGGMVAGALYKKITGRKKNPYNPFVILSWRPGGLAQSAIDDMGEAYSNLVMAAGGDKRALAAFLNALPGMANMFVPFYDISLRGIEAVTDQKNIDYKFVRQIREAISKEYKIRGGAYKVKRDAIERWQYFIGGAGVDQKKKEPKGTGL